MYMTITYHVVMPFSFHALHYAPPPSTPSACKLVKPPLRYKQPPARRPDPSISFSSAHAQIRQHNTSPYTSF